MEFLQRELQAKKAEAVHFETMSSEFEASWAAAEERLKSERAAAAVRAPCVVHQPPSLSAPAALFCTVAPVMCGEPLLNNVLRFDHVQPRK